MLALTMVSAGVTSAVAGYGVDRIDRRLFAGGCFALTGVVVVALATLSLGRALLTVGFVLLGVVMYAIYPAANAIAAGATADMESGSLFAVTQTAAALGGAAGPLVLGTVADLTSITIGFLATAGIALAGVVVVMFGGAFAVHPQAS
jgi:MFS family permease